MATSIALNSVAKAYGAVSVIDDLNLTIEPGEFTVFVGPSGCGKSTLLRMIAGLEPISGGDLVIDGQRMNDVPAAQRGIAMVFQSYALYPHMNVQQNLAFGLETARMPKDVIAKRVQHAADILKIGPLLKRKPKQLSGGQRQRVAIGRAIVREPKIFLFDEPLSNLDAELRVAMRVEIAKLHRDLGNTMIYVTHDQVEAMTMADKIVVLRAGVIEQVGAPLELYNRPRNLFVAGFIGSPKMNFLPDGDGTLGIRPEHASLSGGVPLGDMRVEVVENLGGQTVVHATAAGGTPFTLLLDGQQRIAAGTSLPVFMDPDHAHRFDAKGERIGGAA